MKKFKNVEKRIKMVNLSIVLLFNLTEYLLFFISIFEEKTFLLEQAQDSLNKFKKKINEYCFSLSSKTQK
jgi:hypothetical protein